jgi:hypothetical protein
MTTALAATSSYRIYKQSINPHGKMDTNDALNAFYEGFLDEDGYFGNEDDCIDDDGAVDDDKLEEYMAQQAAADERKETFC